MRISDWISDVCSSDLLSPEPAFGIPIGAAVPADQRSAHHRGDRGEDDGSDVQPGGVYTKCGVLLEDLTAEGAGQADLFATADPKAPALLAAMENRKSVV